MKQKTGTQTDVLIRETAKKIYFSAGRFDATTMDLAKEAGVNKALLHYYYRDRETLLNTVYREAVTSSFLRMFEILTGKGDFETRVTAAVGHLCDQLAEHPFIEAFIVSRINSQPHARERMLPVKEGRAFMRKFLPDTKAYLKKRKISYLSAEEFIVNMMALCAYPPAMSPVASAILGQTAAGYKKFLKKRRKTLASLVLMKN